MPIPEFLFAGPLVYETLAEDELPPLDSLTPEERADATRNLRPGSRDPDSEGAGVARWRSSICSPAKAAHPPSASSRWTTTPLDDLYPVLVSVEVSTSRGEAAAATLIFETRRFEDGTWNVQDVDLLKPWAPVKIEAAFGERVEEVMRGFILRVDADYPANPGETKLTVTCQDESLPLDRAHVREQWGADGPLSDGVILATDLWAPQPGAPPRQRGRAAGHLDQSGRHRHQVPEGARGRRTATS